MDIETKEAMLKLAGYEAESGTNAQGTLQAWRMYNKEKKDNLAYATTRHGVIVHAFNTFLTRQNDVS